MPKDSKPNALAQQARFVFKGTVQKLNAATMRTVQVTDRTAIVKVDEVLQAPEALRQFAGQNITVQIGGRKKATKGQQLVFYSNLLMFGDSVAVQSVDHHEPEKVHAALAMAPVDPVNRLAERDIQTRANTAAAIVSGRVVSVRVPSDVVATRAMAVAQPIATHISEHDPDWRIAEVQVDQVLQGSHEGKTAEVRFPSSNDVMWHDAPRLHAGSEGFFVLHKSDKEKGAARAAPTQDAGEYVALHQADFQPLDQGGGLRNLISLNVEPEVPA